MYCLYPRMGPVRAAPLARRARTQKQKSARGSGVRNSCRAVFGRDGLSIGNVVGDLPFAFPAACWAVGNRAGRVLTSWTTSDSAWPIRTGSGASWGL